MKKFYLVSFLFLLFGCQKEKNQEQNLISQKANQPSSVQLSVNPTSSTSMLLGDCTPSYNLNEIPYLNCFASFKVCIKQIPGEGCNLLAPVQYKTFTYHYFYRTSDNVVVDANVNLGTLTGANYPDGICTNVYLPLSICGNIYISSGCQSNNYCPFEITITPNCKSIPVGTISPGISTKKIKFNDGDSFYTSFSSPCSEPCF